MTLLAGLIIAVPVVAAVLAVRACAGSPGWAVVAVALSLGALGFGAASVARIDEVPIEGVVTAVGAIVCLVLLRVVVVRARSVEPST